jgi:Flp pilus assembly protein TadG
MKRIVELSADFLQRRVSRRWMRCKFMRDEHGNAMIEMALCMSLLGMPLLVGTVELGSMIYTSIEVSNAAHAAAMYGMMSSTFAADGSGIKIAAQNEATDLGSTLGVTPNVYFACSSAIGGTQYSSQTAANTACNSGTDHTLEFVQVNTSVSVTPPIRCPGLPASYTLTGSSTMEVQE